MNGKFVIDVSQHNSTINWKKVKESGVYGAIIRCGFGNNSTKQDDKQFKTNIDGAIKQGLNVGVYIYSYATNKSDAKSEAEHTIRLVKKYKDKLAYPIYYDVEEERTKANAKEIIKEYCAIMSKNGFKNIGIYANEYWWTTFLKGVDNKNKWVARYGKNNGKMNEKPSISCDMWQYTDVGKVNGIKGNVDLNVDFVDIPKKINSSSRSKKDNNTIAKEVIQGKWGNGKDRKQRLTKAGYIYTKIQSIVNKLLRRK